MTREYSGLVRFARGIAIVLVLSPGLLGGAGALAGAIEWQTGAATIDSRTPAEKVAVLEGLVAERSVQPRHVLVQFDRPVDDELRTAVSARGLSLLSYVGENAFFAVMAPERVDVAGLAETSGLVAIEQIRVEWKLHPMLQAGDTPTWAEVGRDASGSPIVGTYVMFQRDVDLTSTAFDVVEAHGGTVRDLVETVNVLVVELPMDAIAGLAEHDAVQWIEPALPRMDVVNDSNSAITQANMAQAHPNYLSGAGVTVLVYDGGTARSTHLDFQGRLTVHDSSGMSDHATHVAGTIGGAGVADPTSEGMAPGVTLLSYGFEYGGSGTFLYSNPGDIEDDYDEAINVFGAEIANNSIGTNTETNGFDCAIQGNYGVTSVLIDEIVRGELGAPFRIIWANGNERQGDRCDIEGFGDFYSTAPPAGAKNHIAVGAVNSNDDSMTSFSSWGPTDDGRIKPDISAPGCQSDDDHGVRSCSAGGDENYTIKCGTSMAAPTVTGLSALLMEDFRDQYPDQTLFRNSTLKAWLVHSAVDRGNVGPDYKYGYGSVRILNAILLMRSGAFVEGSIDQGGTFPRNVVVQAGELELKVTLTWDDVPGTPNVNPALVNDLDLHVYSPSGTRHYPWTLNPASPVSSAVRVQADHVNNIEQVLVDDPEAGTWTVEVRGYNVPDGPQPFSLVGHGANNIGTTISFPDGLPDTAPPNAPQVIDVQITSIGEAIVPGSPTLHYRYDGGAFQGVALTHLGGEFYEGTLPGASCGDMPEFFFSAVGSISGTVYEPAGAPAAVYTFNVGEFAVVFEDNFEAHQGWTVVSSGGLTDGAWDRGIPVNCGRGDPPSDYDGSGRCYLTDNDDAGECNSDVDNGYTWLVSPTINLSGGSGAEVNFALWYSNDFGGDPNNDLFVVYVSNNDGGSWTPVETIGPVSLNDWTEYSFMVDEFVTPTSQVKVRFEASDLGDGSVVEAGIDAFVVSGFTCVGFVDCNNNGVPDDQDIAEGTSQDCNGSGIPDECELIGNDCNENGIPDECELAGNDCNSNGLPDECDISAGTSLDCNANGVPDECELSGNDCNENGIPDDCELAGNDCNTNGMPDECELAGNDCNGNGILDECDIAAGTSQDCQPNGVPDECEVGGNIAFAVTFNMDDDPGWIAQGLWAWGQPMGEGGSHGEPDPTSGHSGPNVYGYNLDGDYENGLPETHLTSGAINCTGVHDVTLSFWRWLGVEQPLYDHAYVRVSNNGSNWVTIWENSAEVADSEWLIQEFDISAFADDQPAVYLRWTIGTTDGSWQYCGWNIDDVEVSGIREQGGQGDCNGNSVPDECDIAAGTSQDCNSNGVPDECDIAAGTSEDDNDNGIPDECEESLTGDMDCDGAVSFDDIDPFVIALGGEGAYQAQYPDCNWLNADINGDGGVDFDDIDPFVALLAGD